MLAQGSWAESAGRGVGRGCAPVAWFWTGASCGPAQAYTTPALAGWAVPDRPSFRGGKATELGGACLLPNIGRHAGREPSWCSPSLWVWVLLRGVLECHHKSRRAAERTGFAIHLSPPRLELGP